MFKIPERASYAQVRRAALAVRRNVYTVDSFESEFEQIQKEYFSTTSFNDAYLGWSMALSISELIHDYYDAILLGLVIDFEIKPILESMKRMIKNLDTTMQHAEYGVERDDEDEGVNDGRLSGLGALFG